MRKHDIKILVTSCPICLRVFRESYHLDGIETLHHSEYIERLIAEGRLRTKLTTQSFAYHDPCELGRGLGIYDSPRNVISAVGNLCEAEHNRERALCCGSSLANTVINDAQQLTIAKRMTNELEATGCDSIITSCPLCNKAIARATTTTTYDISEIIAKNILENN